MASTPPHCSSTATKPYQNKLYPQNQLKNNRQIPHPPRYHRPWDPKRFGCEVPCMLSVPQAVLEHKAAKVNKGAFMSSKFTAFF
ncbi:unnamed protein product [Cochlearia groenlandica]